MASKAVEPSSSTRSNQANQGTMTVGSFKRLEEIGRGSFATVYKASYSKQPGYVAIKSVDLKKLNKKLKENLYSEIEILRGLHHPHIVALVSCQETTAHIHLIMEFCELGDLSYFIRKRDTLGQHKTTAEMIRKYPNPPVGGLNEVVVRHFLKQLASALEFLREKDLIHRDVKPQNLLLDPSPEFYAKVSPESVPYAVHEKSFVPATGLSSLPTLKLADFGFARSLPQTSMAETLCGSPLYMAPEILRYEKYDAKADLWSVGTVLHEMLVGKPPFRAANHVELLRKIEKGDDRIRFQEDINISDNMKRLIRSLLRRNPVERSSFEAFFKNPVIQDEIPGLVENDRPTRPSKPEIEESKAEPSENIQLKQERPRRLSNLEPLSESPRKAESNTQGVQAGSKRPETTLQHRSSGVPNSNAAMQQRKAEQRSDPTRETRERVQQNHRPSIVSHATAPARQDLGIRDTADSPVAVVRRRSNRVSSSPKQSSPLEKTSNRERVLSHQEQKLDREVREARERAAQDVAFERDYVLVEKRAVEVNAFADELAASPRIQGGNQVQQDAHRGAMIRRATTQGSPTSTTGAQNTPSRTMQIASTKRPDQLHHRQSSYDRRYRDATSATSAITKAINLASGRLLNLGFSPPLGLNLGGTSPPSYNPFPAYPTNQGSLMMIGDGSKGQVTMDEDAKMFLLIEEGATRSDVVYCFAEVKYKQLIPLAPSTDRGLGLRQAGIPEGGDGETSTSDDVAMTIDGVVTLAEEALVLYVKALSLLARSMDLANAWWIRKTRGEVIESTSPRTKPSSATTTAAGNRLNNVVQWVRGRFNEVLEKAELVRLKLVESQKQLPSDHPSHPKNQSSQSGSTPAMVKSAENVYITPGVTAEKLMYDRALDMSRSAAVNELVGEDLNGCKIAYETAIRMLEAVLQDDEEAAAAKKVATSEAGAKPSKSEAESVNIVEAEDREVVVKLVSSIRHRLAALKKKSQLIANRNNAVAAATPPAKRSPTPTATPTIASTSPR